MSRLIKNGIRKREKVQSAFSSVFRHAKPLSWSLDDEKAAEEKKKKHTRNWLWLLRRRSEAVLSELQPIELEPLGPSALSSILAADLRPFSLYASNHP